jgi:hypothetical protein
MDHPEPFIRHLRTPKALSTSSDEVVELDLRMSLCRLLDEQEREMVS